MCQTTFQEKSSFMEETEKPTANWRPSAELQHVLPPKRIPSVLFCYSHSTAVPPPRKCYQPYHVLQQMSGMLEVRINETKPTKHHLPFCPSVSLSTSESDAIGFFRFIRRTSSSLSLPLADSTKEHKYSQQIKNLVPHI